MIWIAFTVCVFVVLWLALTIAGTVYTVPVGIALACVGVIVSIREDRIRW